VRLEHCPGIQGFKKKQKYVFLVLTEASENGNWHTGKLIDLVGELSVAKPDLGKKHICQNCGAPFYDLNRKPAVCPKCDTEVVLTPVKARRAAPEKAKPAEEKPADSDDEIDDLDDIVVIADDDDDDDLVDDDDDDDLIEDASDLGVDDDDMSEVKEHIDLGIEDTKD